ncbi:MAG: hypothetical protein KTR24_02270 [Saprospiraceae bacterium]|nr:hypothetical protein [Saprospiraceae bacterium]
MRTYILAFLFILSSSLFLGAQDELTTKGADAEFYIQAPSEGTRSMSLGSHNAFSIVLDDSDSKLVMDTWKSFLKNYKGKTKKVKRSSELFTEDAQAAILGPNPVDIYSLIEKKGSGSILSVWVDAGGAFVSSDDNVDGADGVQFLLDEFQKALHVEHVSLELKEEEKELKNRERILAKLQSANEKLHKQIADWEEKIVKAEGDIETNVQEQAEAEKMIQDQKDRLHNVEVKLAKAKAQ